VGSAKERLLAKSAEAPQQSSQGRQPGKGKFWEQPHRGKFTCRHFSSERKNILNCNRDGRG